MAISQTSNNAAVIEQIVSSVMTETLIQKSVMLGCVSDRSAEVRPGMDRLDIALLDEMTVQTVSETADVTPQDLLTNAAQLDLDQHKSVPFAVSDRLNVQAKNDLIAEAVKNGAMSLAHTVDSFILDALYAGVSTTAPDHLQALTSGDPLADIATSRELLNKQNVPMADRCLVVSPAFEALLLKTESFISAEKYGSSQPIQAGEIGRILGFKVMMSNDDAIVDDGFVAMHRDSFYFARQLEVSLKSEYQVLGHRWDYSLSHLYGGVISQNGAKKFVIFNSTGA